MTSKQQKLKTNQVAELLAKHNSFALFSHTRPDGDTIGATMALKLALETINKSVDVFCDTPIEGSLLKFDSVKDFILTPPTKSYDLCIAIDCGDIFRLGNNMDFFSKQEETLTVDHHGGEFYSKYNCIESLSSTAEIVYEVLTAMNIVINSDIATYLYIGLCTDTGNFSHGNTTCNSFVVASKLCPYGIDIERINRLFFKDKSLDNTKFMGSIISRARSYFEGKLILLYITSSDLNKYNLTQSASEGIVNYAIDVYSALVGICVCEYSDNAYKVSMRGKNFNVRQICNTFGGGGHINASGCMVSGFLEDVIDKLVRAVGDVL